MGPPVKPEDDTVIASVYALIEINKNGGINRSRRLSTEDQTLLVAGLMLFFASICCRPG